MKHDLRQVVEKQAAEYRHTGGDLSSQEWRETILPETVWKYFSENGGLTDDDRALLDELGLSDQLDFEGNDLDA